VTASFVSNESKLRETVSSYRVALEFCLLIDPFKLVSFGFFGGCSSKWFITFFLNLMSAGRIDWSDGDWLTVLNLLAPFSIEALKF